MTTTAVTTTMKIPFKTLYKPYKNKNKSKQLSKAKLMEKLRAQKNKYKTSKALTIKMRPGQGNDRSLFEGMPIKMKCPLFKGLDVKTHPILWTKDGNPVQIKNRPGFTRIKISSKGALRIFRARKSDNGTYACYVGRRKMGEATLFFKDRKTAVRLPPGGRQRYTVTDRERLRDSAAARDQLKTTVCVTFYFFVLSFQTTSPRSSWPKNVNRPGEHSALSTDTKIAPNPREHSNNEIMQQLRAQFSDSRDVEVRTALSTIEGLKKVKAEWTMGDWAPCSTSCGRDG